MKKIIRNRIKCKKCGEIIESMSRHDFKFCKCGAVAVDGGKIICAGSEAKTTMKN